MVRMTAEPRKPSVLDDANRIIAEARPDTADGWTPAHALVAAGWGPRGGELQRRVDTAEKFIEDTMWPEDGVGMEVVDADAVLRILDGKEPW